MQDSAPQQRTETASGFTAAPGATGKLPISVTIITLNEAVRIGDMIRTVQGISDDIIVVDSGSTDATCQIAADLGARVHHRDWTGYGEQKAYAESLARHDWILSLDADEFLSPEAGQQIRDEFRDGPPAPGAYRMWVVFVYPGDTRPRPFAKDHSIVKLFHRAIGGTNTHPIFDRVDLAEGIEPKVLTAPVYHRTITSFDQMVEKGNRFSSHQARAYPNKSALYLKLRLPFEMPYWFFRAYFIRGHFTGGWKGFIFAMNMAYFRMIKIAKLLERIERGRTDEDQEPGT
ncbi:glycosyltransferase family 2 protein [Roseibium sp. RKSG952]|uniref:glycosyltransferase family 2 protein n=1 Tax=Roseibium sp. RKSG952 TaxID=2529384 RepID=UPI0018AD284A|nr:glycosyltransferase family 2 protein [Roseibium sp. RKSG952]